MLRKGCSLIIFLFVCPSLTSLSFVSSVNYSVWFINHKKNSVLIIELKNNLIDVVCDWEVCNFLQFFINGIGGAPANVAVGMAVYAVL